jgi:hypothetical protein
MPEVTEKEVTMTQSILRQVQEKLHAHQMMKLHAGVRKQRLAAKAGGQRTTGDMPVKFAIRPEYYHYWGQRLGYDCWDDEQFVKEFLRDNPECRVENKTGKIQVGYRGQRTEDRGQRTEDRGQRTEDRGQRTRFRKSYGNWKLRGKAACG